MTSTDTEKINYKKLIIGGLVTIIVSVISAILIAYFKPDNEEEKLPKADLLPYQFSEGLFSLNYPSFLVGTEEMIGVGRYALALGRTGRFMFDGVKGKKTGKYNWELTKEFLWGKIFGKQDPNYMFIIVRPKGKDTLDTALKLRDWSDPNKSEGTKDRTTISQKMTNNEKYIIDIVKSDEGVFYVINRFFLKDIFIVAMVGIFDERYWENYKEEIETSYSSIQLDPTRTMKFMQEQYNKQQTK